MNGTADRGLPSAVRGQWAEGSEQRRDVEEESE